MAQKDTEKKNVKVILKTKITNGEDIETFELITFGKYYKKKNAEYLQYEEIDENGKTNTYVKFTDTDVMIMRSGTVKMRQSFRENELTLGHYESIYGILDMKTHTKKLVREWNELSKEGTLTLHYNLGMQENDLGQYEMSVTYKEEEAQE